MDNIKVNEFKAIKALNNVLGSIRSEVYQIEKTVSGIENSDEYLRRFISGYGQHFCLQIH